MQKIVPKAVLHKSCCILVVANNSPIFICDHRFHCNFPLMSWAALNISAPFFRPCTSLLSHPVAFLLCEGFFQISWRTWLLFSFRHCRQASSLLFSIRILNCFWICDRLVMSGLQCGFRLAWTKPIVVLAAFHTAATVKFHKICGHVTLWVCSSSLSCRMSLNCLLHEDQFASTEVL